MPTLLVLLVACGLLSTEAPPPSGCPADPVALVEAAYAPYLGGGAPPDLPVATCWSGAMAARIAATRAAAAAMEDIAPPGFDPVIDGQDWQLSNLAVRAVDADTVEARFDNFGTPSVVTWELVDEGGWRVADLRTARWTLSELLR